MYKGDINMKKIISIILALIMACGYKSVAFADETEPYIRFRVEDKNVVFEWPSVSNGIKLEYSILDDKAYIEYTVTGDININHPENSIYRNNINYVTVNLVSENGEGGTVTANLFSSEGKLLASDTINVSVPKYKTFIFPLYSFLSESAFTGVLLTWAFSPLILWPVILATEAYNTIHDFFQKAFNGI